MNFNNYATFSNNLSLSDVNILRSDVNRLEARAAVFDIRIEDPETEDCDIGNSVITPANPLFYTLHLVCGKINLFPQLF
ncbi:MAG: hypothetical protein HYW34_03065 [Candidatus Brennerbacteria bacterium]|nr:hypothetical protein [Candidatus Brennerbacteria bacterium]